MCIVYENRTGWQSIYTITRYVIKAKGGGTNYGGKGGGK